MMLPAIGEEEEYPQAPQVETSSHPQMENSYHVSARNFFSQTGIESGYVPPPPLAGILNMGGQAQAIPPPPGFPLPQFESQIIPPPPFADMGIPQVPAGGPPPPPPLMLLLAAPVKRMAMSEMEAQAGQNNTNNYPPPQAQPGMQQMQQPILPPQQIIRPPQQMIPQPQFIDQTGKIPTPPRMSSLLDTNGQENPFSSNIEPIGRAPGQDTPLNQSLHQAPPVQAQPEQTKRQMMEEMLARQQRQAANAQALPTLPVPQNQPIGGSRSPARSPRGQKAQINPNSNNRQGLPQIGRMVMPGQGRDQPGLFEESFDGEDLGQGRPPVNPMLAGILNKNKNNKYRETGNAMDGMPKFGSKPTKGLLGSFFNNFI